MLFKVGLLELYKKYVIVDSNVNSNNYKKYKSNNNFLEQKYINFLKKKIILRFHLYEKS